MEILNNYYFHDNNRKLILVNEDFEGSIENIYGHDKNGVVKLNNVFVKKGFIWAYVLNRKTSMFEKREYKLGSRLKDYSDLLAIFNDESKRDKILACWKIDNDGTFYANRYVNLVKEDTNGTFHRMNDTDRDDIVITDFFKRFYLDEESNWVQCCGISHKNPDDKFDSDKYYIVWSDEKDGIENGRRVFIAHNTTSYMCLLCRPKMEFFRK